MARARTDCRARASSCPASTAASRRVRSRPARRSTIERRRARLRADGARHELVELYRAERARRSAGPMPLDDDDDVLDRHGQRVARRCRRSTRASAIETAGAVNHQPEFAAACINASADRAVLEGSLALAWTAIDIATGPVRDRLVRVLGRSRLAGGADDDDAVGGLAARRRAGRRTPRPACPSPTAVASAAASWSRPALHMTMLPACAGPAQSLGSGLVRVAVEPSGCRTSASRHPAARRRSARARRARPASSPAPCLRSSVGRRSVGSSVGGGRGRRRSLVAGTGCRCRVARRRRPR